MLKTIEHLPNRHNLFNYKNYAIYSLDDYSVHLESDVKKALLKKGYIYVGIGGGITGDMQVNDTDMHAPLKKEYRHLESELMLKKLEEDPNKIPQPSRDEMMQMLDKAWESVLEKVDTADRFKCLWLTNNLDGSEDHLVSQRIMDLVGPELLKFRKSLMEKEGPRTMQEMIRSITPPKGVKRKQNSDEGIELLDCDGEELEETEDCVDPNDSEENEGEELEKTDNSVDPNDNEEGEPNGDEMDGEGDAVMDPSSSFTSDAGSSSVNDVQDLAKKFPHLRQDLMVLHELKRLIEAHENDTSRLFKPFMIQLKTTYRNAHLSVRKRMVQCSATNTTTAGGDSMDPEDGSNSSDEELPITFISDNDTLVIFDLH